MEKKPNQNHEWSVKWNAEWDPQYDTGQKEIDFQHRFFYTLISRIYNDFHDSKDNKRQKENLLLELRKYADFHFTSEINIVSKIVSSGLEEHINRHKELLDELDHKIILLKKDECIPEDFFKFLINWFFGHTYFEDQKLFGHKHS